MLTANSIKKKIKPLFFVLLFIFFSTKSFSNTYTFTGNGDWSISSNWAGNLIPPNNSGANDILINGSATLSSGSLAINSGGSLTVNGSLTIFSSLYIDNGGVVTINTGGNLTMDFGGGNVIPAQLNNYGNTTVNAGGTFHLKLADVQLLGNMTVNGSFINNSVVNSLSGNIIVNGVMTNNAPIFAYSGDIIINTGGAFSNTPSYLSYFFNCNNLVINTGGVFSNTGTMNGNTIITGTLPNSGNIAPGNSPGIITINGDYTAASSASHTMEIAGTTPAQYDRINISGNAFLNGTLNVSLINGFVPSGVHDIIIISASSITGTFSSVTIPSGYSLVYNTTNVTLHFGGILPVDINNFSADLEGKYVYLSWQTLFEQNNQGFVIEKSTDANNWQSISFVNGRGNSTSPENYSYLDKNPYSDINYYRLKQIDIDGNTKYSSIISVTFKKNNLSLLVYPNPTKTKLNFGEQLNGNMTIYNSLGQIVIKQNLNNASNINISGLSAGQYFLQLLEKNLITKQVSFIIK